MPVKRRASKLRAGPHDLSDLEHDFLQDAIADDDPRRADPEMKWQFYELSSECRLGTSKPFLADLWAEFRDDVLTAWIADRPGTRPSLWWRFDAPRASIGTYEGCYYDGALCDGRRRLGGTGTASQDALALVPEFTFGLPVRWITAADVVTYNLACPTVDLDDLPLFEAEAFYLDRHGLLFAAERKRLPADAFEPEAIASSHIPH